MPITTKKYIPADRCHLGIIGNNSCYEREVFVCSKNDVVELPDFSKATDIEKLEWLLMEFGLGCHENQFSGKARITANSINDLSNVSMLFDESGKLVKLKHLKQHLQ